MKYDLFLFDLDDTLLNFQASEKQSFAITLESIGLLTEHEELYSKYKLINEELWKAFEHGETTKDLLKVERFKRLLDPLNLGLDPQQASARYLEALPETVVLVEHAIEICEWLSQYGEIGIITNGIHEVQTKRIQNSRLAPFISFVGVSELCGFAKPDVRFFEYCSQMAKKFSKDRTIIIGDRFDADIVGAHRFGIDSCWYNPFKKESTDPLKPTFEIRHLSELKDLLQNS
jgi:2-haloacid dehalogenase